MKKLFLSFFWVFLILLTLIIFTLSTVGITTERFNSFITKRINETNTNIDLKLSSVDFRLDIKQFSLFLETNNPKISYRELSIPIKNIKVYIDFISIIKTKPEIYKINFSWPSSRFILMSRLPRCSNNIRVGNHSNIIELIRCLRSIYT